MNPRTGTVRAAAAWSALAVALGVVTGCAGMSSARRTTIIVLAASSLTDVLPSLGAAYPPAREDVRLRYVFGGSEDIAAQVRDRVPADVVVTADQPMMTALRHYVNARRVIARNTLAIAVAPGNPHRVKGLADLARPSLRVALGAPGVPSGRYARTALAKAGVTVRPVSEEADARTVLDRVRSGEADAAIVYATDVRSAGAAAGDVPIPAEVNVTTEYPAAIVARSGHQDAAKAFLNWLGSTAAAAILRSYGFG